MDDVPVHQMLFRLAARAPELTLDQLMERVTTGVANHFAAVACSIHTDASGWASAAAEPISEIQALPRLDRARLETIEAAVVKGAVANRKMMSALDLENAEDAEELLRSTLGVVDIFAFPLIFEAKIRAVLVLYLSLDSEPLRDADIHGLSAVGELLALAGEHVDPAS